MRTVEQARCDLRFKRDEVESIRAQLGDVSRVHRYEVTKLYDEWAIAAKCALKHRLEEIAILEAWIVAHEVVLEQEDGETGPTEAEKAAEEFWRVG